MKPELRAPIIAASQSVTADREKSEDFMTLLGALPPGQVKNLLKDPTIGPILQKYGITGV